MVAAPAPRLALRLFLLVSQRQLGLRPLRRRLPCARHSNIIVFGVKYNTNYELLYSVNHCSANGICPLVELQTKYPKIPRAHQNVSAAFAAPILAHPRTSIMDLSAFIVC